MSKLVLLKRDYPAFYCPGCNQHHAVPCGDGPRPRWSWNGSKESPTFSPSILVHGTVLSEKGKADYEEWQRQGFPKRDGCFDTVDTICHSFITDGRIQFLSDCTHALAGQTVDLPNIEGE
jgi:hypothetical protein